MKLYEFGAILHNNGVTCALEFFISCDNSRFTG